MNIIELNDKLRAKAIENNACDTAMSKWNGYFSQEQLIDLWLHHYDFAIDNNFPTPSFIVENFDRKVLRDKNVFVNEHKIMERNRNGIVAVQGDSKGMLLFDSLSASKVYVRNSADLTISCKGMSKVFIEVHDNAKVHIEQGEMSKVYLYVYGNNADVTYNGDVNFRQK